MTCADFCNNWKRCKGILILSVTMAVIAIPFFIAFIVQFVEGEEEWKEKGKDILPGDLMLYASLVFFNFAWVFFVVYYSMTLTAKTYSSDVLETSKQLKKSAEEMDRFLLLRSMNESIDLLTEIANINSDRYSNQ